MDKQDILDMIEIDEDDLFLEYNYRDSNKVIHTPTGISVNYGTTGLMHVFYKDDAIKILKARLLSKLINDMGKEEEEKEEDIGIINFLDLNTVKYETDVCLHKIIDNIKALEGISFDTIQTFHKFKESRKKHYNDEYKGNPLENYEPLNNIKLIIERFREFLKEKEKEEDENEEDIEIDHKDLIIESATRGCGSNHEKFIRITHNPSSIVIECNTWLEGINKLKDQLRLWRQEGWTKEEIKEIHKRTQISDLIGKIEYDINILKKIDLPHINGIEYHFNRLKELVI